MRKFLLIASIFTVLTCNVAKAERYYEEDGYYYREEPRYVRNTEYVEDRYYKREQPRYQRIKKSDIKEIKEPTYRQRTYQEDEEPNKIRPYIGIDIATSKLEFSESYYEDVMEDGHNSLSLVVGAKFNKNFGVEAFIQQSSEEEKKDSYWGDSEKTSYNALGLDFIGYLPVNQEIELLASLGLAQYNFNETYEYDDGFYSEWEKSSLNTIGIRIGLGAQFNLTDNVSLRAMARYIKLNDDDIIKSMTELSLGLRYMF